MKSQKFFSKKIVLKDGTIFDSKLEYNRWLFLLEQQKSGAINSLSRQSSFELIPKQFMYVSKVLKTKVKFVKVVAEHPCTYKADFTYRLSNHNNYLVVEDTKSKATRTPEYRIKRKLMLQVHGIRIYEVDKPTMPIFTIQNSIRYEENETQTQSSQHPSVPSQPETL